MLTVGMLETTLRLSRPESRELQARARSRVLRAGDVRRARLILMLSEGQSWSAIQQALGCSSAYIARWQARFAQQRLAGLFARPQGRAANPRPALRSSAWRACWPAIRGGRRPSARLGSKPAFWPGPGARPMMAPLTGAAASWRGRWGSIT